MEVLPNVEVLAGVEMLPNVEVLTGVEVVPNVEVLAGVEMLPNVEVLPGVEVQYICYRTAESEWSPELVTLAFVSFSLKLGTEWERLPLHSTCPQKDIPVLPALSSAGIPTFLRRQTGFLCCLLFGNQAGKNRAELCGHTALRSPAWWFPPRFYTTGQAAGHTPPVPFSFAPPSGGQ